MKFDTWFHMWTLLTFTCDVFVYDVHMWFHMWCFCIWCSHMKFTCEVWYMISHVNMLKDHIRFSRWDVPSNHNHQPYNQLRVTSTNKNQIRWRSLIFLLRGWTLLSPNANWLRNCFDLFHWPNKERIQHLRNFLFSVEKSKKSSEIRLFLAANDFVFFQL